MAAGGGGSTGGRGLTRRTVLAAAGGLAAAAPAAAAQQPRGGRRIGVPGPGRAAAEVVGRVVQDGFALTGYGFLSRVSGVSDVFRDGELGEGTARFTFTAEAEVRERYLRGALVVAIGTGTVSFHLSERGADFDAPDSFGTGLRIASFTARFQNVLTITGPDQAVTSIEGELLQRTTRRFSLGGRRHRYGRPGLRGRLSVEGPGTRTDPAVPRAVFDVAGRLDVAD